MKRELKVKIREKDRHYFYLLPKLPMVPKSFSNYYKLSSTPVFTCTKKFPKWKNKHRILSIGNMRGKKSLTGGNNYLYSPRQGRFATLYIRES